MPDATIATPANDPNPSVALYAKSVRDNHKLLTDQAASYVGTKVFDRLGQVGKVKRMSSLPGDVFVEYGQRPMLCFSVVVDRDFYEYDYPSTALWSLDTGKRLSDVVPPNYDPSLYPDRTCRASAQP